MVAAMSILPGGDNRDADVRSSLNVSNTSQASTPRSVHELLAFALSAGPMSNMLSVEDTSRLYRRVLSTNRRPQCTHTTVIRVYGKGPCQICGKAPSLGWLYACQQDRQFGSGESQFEADKTNGPAGPYSTLHQQASIAEELGMSASIVHGIRAQKYSFDEVKQLLDQRKTVIRTIKQGKPAIAGAFTSANSPPTSTCTSHAATAPVGIQLPEQHNNISTNLRPEAGEHEGTPASRRTPGYASGTACSFMVCHVCRPFFRDRLYTSVEPVLNGEVPNLTLEDLDYLSLKNAKIMSTIGLRKLRRSRQQMAYSQTNLAGRDVDDADDEISVDWTPTSSGVSDEPQDTVSVNTEGLSSRNKQTDHTQDHDFSSDAGSLGQDCFSCQTPKPKPAQKLGEQSRHFEDCLLSTPGGASTVSSISLPTPSTAQLVPLSSTDHPFQAAIEQQCSRLTKAKSTNSVGGDSSYRLRPALFRQDSSSSLGSELEVQGGVALTEEAVEMGVPDIVTEQDSVMV